MANLGVNICGVELKNPVIAASGTYGFGREMARHYDPAILGGISAKALTIEKRLGNPEPRIAETASGMLNAVGLQNPGVDAFLAEELPRMRQFGTAIIANVAGSSIDEYIQVMDRLRGSGIDMVELNISCPNVKHGGMALGTSPEAAAEVTREIKAVCDVPLMVKLSPNVSDICAIALAVQQAGADCVSLINTLTGMVVDLESRKPLLANVTGGMSGPAVKPVALRLVYEVSHVVDIPVVGMGGIMSATDVLEFMLCGAQAVMVGTANLVNPYACKDIIDDLEKYLDNKHFDINDFVGALEV